LGHVFGRRPLLPLHDVELDALTFGERLESIALDGRVMNEAVLLSILGRNEAEPLGIVEPLDRACRTHCPTPLVLCCVGSAEHPVPTDTTYFVILSPHDGPSAECGTFTTKRKKACSQFGRPHTFRELVHALGACVA